MITKATWIKGKKEVTGKWQYNWAADSFTIQLDQIDRTTGQQKVIITRNDTPEFNGWRLKRADTKHHIPPTYTSPASSTQTSNKA